MKNRWDSIPRSLYLGDATACPCWWNTLYRTKDTVHLLFLSPAIQARVYQPHRHSYSGHELRYRDSFGIEVPLYWHCGRPSFFPCVVVLWPFYPFLRQRASLIHRALLTSVSISHKYPVLHFLDIYFSSLILLAVGKTSFPNQSSWIFPCRKVDSSSSV